MTPNERDRELYEGRLKARRDAAAMHKWCEEAEDRGMMMGEILAYQKILGEALTSRDDLLVKPLEELTRLASFWLERVKSGRRSE